MDSLTLKNWIIHFTNQNSKFDDIPIDVPEYIILGSYKLNFEWFRLLQWTHGGVDNWWWWDGGKNSRAFMAQYDWSTSQQNNDKKKLPIKIRINSLIFFFWTALIR